MPHVLELATNLRLADEVLKKGLFYKEQQPGELMILPAGMVTAEQTVPAAAPVPVDCSEQNGSKLDHNSIVIGVRYHVFESRQTPGHTTLRNMVSKQQNQQIKDNKTRSFWQ